MDLILTDFLNGYHFGSKGIKTFIEMPIGAEKKSQATDNRFKNSFFWDPGQLPCLHPETICEEKHISDSIFKWNNGSKSKIVMI